MSLQVKTNPISVLAKQLMSSSNISSLMREILSEDIKRAYEIKEVKTEQDYSDLMSVYAIAKEIKDKVEKERKELNEPYQEQIKKNNAKGKTITEILDEVIELAKQKTSVYINEIEKQKEKLFDISMSEGANFFGIEPEVCVPMSSLRSEKATAVSRVDKKFRLIDISKVPTQYLMLDESAIKKALKKGIISIDGLEIYEEQSIYLKRN